MNILLLNWWVVLKRSTNCGNYCHSFRVELIFSHSGIND